MKLKSIITLATTLMSMSMFAQITESFDANNLGWMEHSLKKSKAIIQDGKLHLESKDKETSAFCSCWAPIDPAKNFVFSSDVYYKKVSDDNAFGVVFNYKDDYNACYFCFDEDNAYFWEIRDNVKVRFISRQIKLQSKKKTVVKLDIKHTLGKIEFLIDDVQAIEVRNVNMESVGLGYFVLGEISVDVEEARIIQ